MVLNTLVPLTAAERWSERFQSSRKSGLEFITWDIAVSGEGAVHVVLGTNAWKLKLPKEEWGYLYARRLPGATEFEPVRNLNHRLSEGFSLAIGTNGAVAAVWMAEKLFATISSDGGKTFGAIIAIDPQHRPLRGLCCGRAHCSALSRRNGQPTRYVLGFLGPQHQQSQQKANQHHLLENRFVPDDLPLAAP